jgi:HPt (histidine-containing phosphotransfer) domain-containing protein
LQAALERWAELVCEGKSLEGAFTAKPPEMMAVSPPQRPENVSPPAHAAPVSRVDMARLKEFTDGTPENMRELIELYLEQTSKQMEELKTAHQAGDVETIRKTAHSAAGSSGTCGIRALSELLREIERATTEDDLPRAGKFLPDALSEFQEVKNCLQEHLAEIKSTPGKSS